MIAQGISGTIKWMLDDEGTLFFEPINGKEGTFGKSKGYSNYRDSQGYEWNDYGKDIKKICSCGKINLPENVTAMFSGCSSLTNIDALKNWNVGAGTNVIGMFEDCSSLTKADILQVWNVQNS